MRTACNGPFGCTRVVVLWEKTGTSICEVLLLLFRDLFLNRSDLIMEDDCHQMVFDVFAGLGYRIGEMLGNLNFPDGCPRNPANVHARVRLTASLPLV